MRRKLFRVGIAWRLLIALILALCLVPIDSSPVAALSVDDYFEITYEPVEFSKTEINGSEVFNATITVTATCTNDLPLPVTEARITARIIAEHEATDAKVTLNSSYTVTISPFPQKGETAQEREVVPLQFPEGSESGNYNIVGVLDKAEVTVLGIAIPVTEYLPSSQTMGSVTYTAPDGGGGGGGGFSPTLTPTAEEVKATLFGVEGEFSIDDDGVIQETIEATSDAGDFTIAIPEGTIALDEDGDPLSTLTVELDLDPPDPPAEAHIIGIPYKLGPPGATFSPPMTIEFTVDPATLPPGVAVEDLVLAYYNETLVPPAWVELPTTYDPATNTFTAEVEHFTTFAIIGAVIPPEPVEPALAPAPAIFTHSSLSISPIEVNIGDEVTISLLVANTGGKSGSYEVTLKIDGVVAATKEVTVSAGFSKEVTFTISKDIAGIYSVDVNGLTDSFTVKEEETAVISTPPTSPPAEDTSSPPPAEETSQPPPTKEINWPVVYGVVVALVAMGSLLFFLARRSHTKSSS